MGFSILSFVIAPIIFKEYHHETFGEIIETLYGSKAKTFINIVSIIVSLGYIAGQFHVLGNIISSTYDMSAWIAILIGASIVTFYTAIGGLRGVIITDVIQFVFILLMMPNITLYCIERRLARFECTKIIIRKYRSMA